MNEPEVRRFFLSTLGAAALESLSSDGSRSVHLRAGKPLALIVYLALSENRTASREFMLDLLWSDVEPERGRRTLRQTIWQIRQTLGADFLLAQDGELTLTAALLSDRDNFLHALQEKDFDLAVRTYAGPFLPDFGVPGGVEFEHWTDRERARLQSGYVRAARSLIRNYLDASRFRDAVREARRLRDSDANNESSWRLLLESLASIDDRIALLMEAEVLENQLRQDNREPEPATDLALKKARREHKPEFHLADQGLLVAELTGREKEFAQITRAWEIAKSGTFQHVHISAPAGIGKTRLLAAVHARIRARGARVANLRARLSERSADYSLASDFAAAVSELSGAAGISSSAAGALVALNPGLSFRFAVPPDLSEGPEAFRRRVLATVSALTAIADDGPFAILIDDLHWGDSVSRRFIQNILPRITRLPALVVTTARPVPEGELKVDETSLIELSPLSEEHVRALVGSFANLPQSPWVARLLQLLYSETVGSPFLILENLRLSLEKQLLRIVEGEWSCIDEDGLREELTAGAALNRRIRKLEPKLHELLVVLAVAETPIREDVLSWVLPGRGAVLETDLAVLEQHALATHFGDVWECAHDIVSEAVLRDTSDELRREVHSNLGRALVRQAGGDLSLLERAAHHLYLARQQGELNSVFLIYVDHSRRRGDQRSPRRLAEEILGHSPTTAESRSLVSSLPFSRRFGIAKSSLQSIAFLLVLVTALTVAALLGASQKPVKLGVAVQPIAGNTAALVPAPVVEIQDANGVRVKGSHDSVTAQLVAGIGILQGTTTVAAKDGRAVFTDLSLTDEEHRAALRFTARGLQPIESGWVNDNKYPAILKLVDGRVNGQRITPSDRRIVVHPDEQITASLHLVYSSLWPTASVMLGATPTWGDRRRDLVDLAPLATPAVDQPRRTSFVMKGPSRPGLYHIILAFDAEGNVEDFMSGTNWTLKHPIWHDGNDIVDWTPAQIAEANSFGRVTTTLVRINSSTAKPSIEPHTVGATAIEILAR